MTKIPLRAYDREIEEAIDQKQFEEAIAHCLHILKTYPKHVATYRLLGKAYLESQRYGNAADIFQRVLSSVPDDFVSHVGMSIIREDEGNLDAAIWHMERAFESQSYNTAIQGELRRLYGQRDGMEPPKIRMTRGALARMYAKSDLYEQAIAEIRATLAMDPKRPDLQVLLGKMYAKNGQNADAIEVCSSLLQHLPYCLDANRLIAGLLSESEHKEDIQIYRQRIQALDPYEAHVSPTTPSADNIPDQAITILKIVWDGGPIISETADQPEWATAIGVSLDDTEEGLEEEELPDWLVESAEDYQEIERETEGEIVEDLIPEWMQDAGWKPATGELDERVPSLLLDDEEIEDSEFADAETGEIPEWLKDIAPDEFPKGEVEVIEELSADAISEELPDWLSEEADDATDTIITWLDEKEKLEEVSEEPEIAPDIDRDELVFEDEDVAERTMVSGEVDEIDSDEVIPEWLQDLGQEVPMERESSGVTDWLKKLQDEISDQVEEAESEPVSLKQVPEVEEEPEPVHSALPDDFPDEKEEDEEIPEWLLRMKEETEETETIVEHPLGQPLEFQSEEPFELEEEGVPEWLSSLEKESLESQMDAELVSALPFDDYPDESEVEEESVDLPEWLQKFDDSSEEPEPVLETQSEETFEVPEEIKPDEIPDWLKSLDEESKELEIETDVAADSTESELLEEAPEAEPEEIMEWMQSLDEEARETEPEIEAGVPIQEGELPREDIHIDSDRVLEWLESLEEETREPDIETEPVHIGASDVVSEEEPEPAEIPEWLEGLVHEETEPASIGELEEVSEIEVEIEPTELAPSEEPIAEVPTSFEGEVEEELDFEDAEAALAWLDGLALGDSITDEELSTRSPEETILSEEALTKEDEDVYEEVEQLPEIGFEEIETIEAPDWEDILEEAEQMDILSEEDLIHEEEPSEFETREPVVDLVSPEKEGLESQAEEAKPEIKFEDAEDALAWLEGLAAKQGVSEEELITRPEERLEIPPDWVQEEMLGETDEEIEEILDETKPVVEIPDWLLEAIESEDIEATVTTDIEPELQEDIEEVTISADLPEILQDAYELGEDIVETPADLKRPIQITKADEEIEEEPTTEDIPEWLLESVDEEAAEVTEEPVVDFMDTVVEVAEVAESDVGVEEPLVLPSEEELIPEVDLEQVDKVVELELPDLVKEEVQPEEEEYQWLPVEVDEDIIETKEPLEINEASLKQLERLQALGFQGAQAIVAFRDEYGPFENLEDLLNVPGITLNTIDAIRSDVRVSVPPEPEPKVITDTLTPPTDVEPEDKFHAIQMEAAMDFSQGNTEKAINKYNQLIKKGKRLENVIKDLNQILSGDISNEIYIEVLQILGDAYMKADRLQEALDAYTKAEDLLR